MIKANNTRYEHDKCIYFKQCSDDLTYLLLYADDIMIVVRNETLIQKVKPHLKKFDMKYLREGKRNLGTEISQDRCTCRLRLSQENYVFKILKKFNMAEARLITTHLASHLVILQSVFKLTRR